MTFLHALRLRFSPPRLTDPDFGELVFMHIPDAPEKSYWEGVEWPFPPTGALVCLEFLGDESGPLPDSRRFYLALPGRFPALLELVRPALDKVFRDWYDRPLSSDVWQDVKLTGFGLEDPRGRPVRWDISFEATGEKWLGISVPFEDDTPGVAIVDT